MLSTSTYSLEVDMRAFRDLLWLCLVATLVPASAFSQARAPEEATDAEYAVYSAVLDQLYPGAARTAYLVADTTRGSFLFGVNDLDIILWSLREMPEVPPEMVHAYERANGRTAALEAERFHTRLPVETLGAEELSQLREESMDRHSAGYADSVAAREDLTFSRVGFSVDGRSALLHVLMWCGGRCGQGRVLLLERSGGGWLLKASRQTVIS